MATISEITQAASYQGSKELGGFVPSAIEINTKPLEDLARYTLLYNQSEYNQRQKNADEKIAELALNTAFNLNNVKGKDREAGVQAMAELQKYAAEYASRTPSANPQDKIKSKLEYQTRVQNAKDILTSINARGIGYNVRKNEILKNDAAAGTKDAQLRQLEEEFDGTDVFTQISALPKFDLKVPEVAPPIYGKTEVSVNTGNGIFTQTIDFFDPRKNMDASFAEANDIKLQNVLPANASDLQKQEFEQKATVTNNSKVWQDAASFLNASLVNDRYKNEKGQLDINAIKSDNPIAANIIQLAERWNDYASTVAQRDFNDKMGNKVKAIDVVNPQEYFTIDVTKPISPEQIIFLKKFAMAQPDKKATDYKETNDVLELQRLAQDEAQSKRNNALGWANLNWDKDKFNAQMQGTESTKNGATLFAERIYNELKGLADSNGVITPDKIRQLTVEQRKYLGYDAPNTISPDGTETKGLQSLVISDTDAIHLNNGRVMVLGNAKFDKKANVWRGMWDNSRTTTVSNIATNRLNEQLTKAGSKELNSYLPLDAGNIDVQSDVSGGRANLSTDKADWKKEGGVWIYKDGTKFDDKGNQIK